MKKEFEERMRHICHVTSLNMAMEIQHSQRIWGSDSDGAANFHPNQTSANQPNEASEVSLEFRWEGDIEIRDANTCRIDDLKAGVMYVFVTNGIDDLSLDRVKVWACKIPRGTKDKLKCVGIAPFEFMLKQRGFKAKFDKLKTHCLNGFEVSVPSNTYIDDYTKSLYSPQLQRKSLLRRLLCKVFG